MGSELVGACIFCASLLLGTDLPPRPGLGAELGFSYATMARRFSVTPERDDGSDITPKFLLIGLGNSRPAEDGLGAGTPVSGWRARIAFAASHDEQERKPAEDLESVRATGTGRYENFAVQGRYSLGARDSIEVGVEDRSNKSTDLINIGGENGELSSERSITASRVDLGAGWRHRWKGLEAQAGLRWTHLSGYNSTATSFQKGSGAILGGEAEIRWRQGRWTAMLRGERASGSIDVHRESAPDFRDRDSKPDASLGAALLGIGYSWPRTEFLVSGDLQPGASPVRGDRPARYGDRRLRLGARSGLGQQGILRGSGVSVRRVARDPAEGVSPHGLGE